MTKKKAPAGQGEGKTIQRREGPTVYTHITAPTPIHPEIPVPHWAEDRYLDDDDREVIDERATSCGNFDIELARMYTFTETGRIDHDENMCLWWDSVWSDGGTDRESFTVRLADVASLIAALQHAHDLMTNGPRTLRRDPDVTSELMERDQ